MNYPRVIRPFVEILSKAFSPAHSSTNDPGAGRQGETGAHQPPEIQAYHAASTFHALRRIASRNTRIATVIDVGASNGMWSAVAMQHFPDAQYLLIEAQRCHEKDLIAFCNERSNSNYALAAAGEALGEIYFDDRDPFGGVASTIRTEWATTKVKVTTVDWEIQQRDLPAPYLIKLDTHGFEVPILEGAKNTLAAANVLCIEVYNFKILEESLLFYEMCAYLDERGFRPIDFSEPLWRDYDRSLWQFDLFFVPKTRPELSYNQYR